MDKIVEKMSFKQMAEALGLMNSTVSNRYGNVQVPTKNKLAYTVKYLNVLAKKPVDTTQVIASAESHIEFTNTNGTTTTYKAYMKASNTTIFAYYTLNEKVYNKPIKVYPFILLFNDLKDELAAKLKVDRVKLKVLGYNFKHDDEVYKERLAKLRRGYTVAKTTWKAQTKLYRESDLVQLYLNGIINDPCIKMFHIDNVVSSYTISNFIKHTVIPYAKVQGELVDYKKVNGRKVLLNSPVWEDQRTSWDVAPVNLEVNEPLVTLMNDNLKSSKYYFISTVKKPLSISKNNIRSVTYNVVHHEYVKGSLRVDNNIIGLEFNRKCININGYTVNTPNEYISFNTRVNKNHMYVEPSREITDLPDGKAIINNFVFSGMMPTKLWEVIPNLCYRITDYDTELWFKGNAMSIAQRIAGVMRYIRSIPFDLDVYFRVEPAKSYHNDLLVIQEASKCRQVTRKFKDYNSLAADVEEVVSILNDYGEDATILDYPNDDLIVIKP